MPVPAGRITVIDALHGFSLTGTCREPCFSNPAISWVRRCYPLFEWADAFTDASHQFRNLLAAENNTVSSIPCIPIPPGNKGIPS